MASFTNTMGSEMRTSYTLSDRVRIEAFKNPYYMPVLDSDISRAILDDKPTSSMRTEMAYDYQFEVLFRKLPAELMREVAARLIDIFPEFEKCLDVGMNEAERRERAEVLRIKGLPPDKQIEELARTVWDYGRIAPEREQAIYTELMADPRVQLARSRPAATAPPPDEVVCFTIDDVGKALKDGRINKNQAITMSKALASGKSWVSYKKSGLSQEQLQQAKDFLMGNNPVNPPADLSKEPEPQQPVEPEEFDRRIELD